MRLFLIAILLCIVTGCSHVPFKETELVPTAEKGAAELAASLWTRTGELLLVRQSALFEFQGMEVPITGVMELDLSRKRARLVGMDDLGVKLFDISVDQVDTTANFVIPALAHYRRFADAVGDSVRRIFLEPDPEPTDDLDVRAKSYRLTRSEGGQSLSFLIGGADAQLLEKESRGEEESWRVRYYQYRRLQGILVPGGVVLDDLRAGYRLTLWTESVDKIDE